MAGDIQQQLERLKFKADLLTKRYVDVLSERDEAMDKIAQLEALIERQKKDLQRLEHELEYQKIATTISQSSEDVERSRAVLTELMREIDSCINELTN